MTTVKEKNALTDEELKLLIRFVEIFSELAQDTEKAAAVTATNPVHVNA